MTDWLLRGDWGTAPTDLPTTAMALLLAFVCGHTIAWLYMLTHNGLSYSRSYVNTLILLPMTVALVMTVLANNLVLAFGLMAIFAMVRFRSILRDTLDTAYVLAAIVMGLACGTAKFTSAVIGCLATAAVMLYLRATDFGVRHRYDVILSMHWGGASSELDGLQRLLRRHCRTVRCASQQADGGRGGVLLSYRLLLRDPARSAELAQEVSDLAGVSRVSCLHAEDESEL
jgi:hypothetical protein